MEWMQPWMAIPAMLLVHFGLKWLSSTDTEAGRRIRASDHAAWEMEMERQHRRLEELKAVEPGA